ncbi:YggS family pyridoxal phosphate-dependent enzyme [Emticicia sp. 21SJ11W-3]|uniref:YggS family pyridoxal phosphate-dependent enzyme n=1 Tax=Emticicia sp. 21SJ11W-3 TaxID=2916755 RepID=UPI0020A12D6C|nr:YggS family pyridoxal phosphate-dependent enzyme [Emticicia sp. 21SJ11W-3]UTA69376.1 YggS family pyridoxal phosphate-dependent enzyme [Emticicia sp. 21SJ11W-3]
MSVAENIKLIENEITGKGVTLVAVSKTKPVDALMQAYNAGFKRFGENYVQELADKYEQMPKDIEWHFIGHLQSNKVKYIAPFVSLIHSVDSFKLLQEINKQAAKYNRVINCLLQIYIAEEDTKSGMTEAECSEILDSEALKTLLNVNITGLMGMSTFTDDEQQVRKEFRKLKSFQASLLSAHPYLQTISMGMSGDYPIAIEEGSTMIRVGSRIFGNRIYPA